ncbi:MAG: pyruvate dehydrogenase complex E1 component subunit beta [Proteobacteria bacterium]|nr:pyruvate dehydrogenase complex E1 component subunit beta [Pseudomonadota bacterium]
MSILTYREALGRAMSEEMTRDPKVFLMGEEVAQYNGAYKVSKGMLDKFGPSRVIDSPISEGGFAGLGVGAAMAGLRPIIEMMTWNFGIQAFDQIINHAAKMLYMSAGQFPIPMVFRGPNGAAHMLSAQHSQTVEGMLTQVPGLKVVTSANPSDGYGLLKTSIRDNNPVIFLESEMMYAMKGEVDDAEFLIPLGQGRLMREGQHVTLIAWAKMVQRAMDVAAVFAEQGIECEVIDPRSLRPLDEEMIFNSIRKTHRCVIIEEAYQAASVGSWIVELVQRVCFDELDAPVMRVSNEFVPMPYAENLEHRVLPEVERIIPVVKQVLYMD